jgi:aminotransferase
MIAALMAIIDPGDEVVIFEPFYENYGPDAILCGATPRQVTLHPPDWRFDPDELRRAFSPRTRAVILNTPNNPTGKVFSREELLQIAELCREFDAVAITDEIYEHIVYDGATHIPMMTLPGMRERSILVNSMSKTYSVTGWRVGWVIAPPDVTGAVRKVHDFLTVGAAAPLQQAGAVALAMPESYYTELAASYAAKRDMLVDGLEAAGFRCFVPRGAYYVMTDISGFDFPDCVEFVRFLTQNVGVAAVPGTSFYARRTLGAAQVRFCFCKKYETLEEVNRRLAKFNCAGQAAPTRQAPE